MSEPQQPLTRMSGAPGPRGISPKQLAMLVLFGSITMLFGASIVGYLITRSQNDIWRTAAMPGLPVGLLASTALLIALSVSMHVALRAVRENRFEQLQRGLMLALFFGVSFVLAQALNWRAMFTVTTATEARTLYGFTFYMLTGLHGLHILGGLAVLAHTTVRAFSAKVQPDRLQLSVDLSAIYSHFMLAVWLLLFALFAGWANDFVDLCRTLLN